MSPTLSLFDRWIARPRRPWLIALGAVALLAAPPVAAAFDGTLSTFLTSDGWRQWLYPTVIVYILAVAPRVARMDRAVAASSTSNGRITLRAWKSPTKGKASPCLPG